MPADLQTREIAVPDYDAYAHERPTAPMAVPVGMFTHPEYPSHSSEQHGISLLMARWEVIQETFVDDPQRAVAEADQLVQQVTRVVQEQFDRQRADLEAVWASGQNASTEQLRTALQRYRTFFQRLVSFSTSGSVERGGT